MSIFQSKVTDIQKENSNYYRSSGFGQVVPTSSVIQLELKENPWFLSITNASESDVRDTLQIDSAKIGYSVVVADYGSSRQTRTIVNPKGVNTYAGSSTGKDTAVVPGQDTFFELNYNNHISPSVLGMYSLEQPSNPVNNNSEVSTQTGDPTIPIGGILQGEVGNSADEFVPFNPGAPAGYAPEGQPFSAAGMTKVDIDSKGKITKTKDTGMGPQQNPIRTGTTLITPSGLKDLFNFEFFGN